MGTPASLLDLIATGGSRRLALNAELNQRAAQAKQAEAAARHADAETEKATIEAEAMRQAQADQQVFSEAFKHSANPKHIDAYIRANASGSGINAWQKASDEHQKSLLEMDEKRRKGEADKAEQIGSIISSVMTLPPDKRASAWAQQVIPAIQQVDPSIKLSPEYDEGSIPVMLGKARYTKAAADQADAIAKAKKAEVDIANAQQEGELKQRAAFLQGVRPDMPLAEYKALPGYEKFGKIFPSPAAAAVAARVEGVPVKDRAEAEQKARVLAGMSPTGITAEQDARLKQQQKEAEQRAQQHRESLGVTMRGQNMANDRALEAREARPVTEAESKTYGYYKRMNDAEQTISAMAGKMAEKGLFGQAAMKYAPNWLQSEDNQVFEQASRQFTEARLRRDSGAAIPTHEYDNDKRMYFPQPGDTPETQKRKDKARAVVLETMKKEAGRAIERFDGVKVGTGGGSDPNIEQLQKQFPGATITRVP